MNEYTAHPNIKLCTTLEQFDHLVGEWDIDITNSQYWSHIVHGRVSIQPAEDGAFLIWRSNYEQPGPPGAVYFVGGDESAKVATILYFDVRGVSRVLQTSFENGIWLVWRDAPGFDQRLTGQVSSEGKTMQVRVEKSLDGSNWTLDFYINYTRRMNDV